jgi:hypothetical protein
MEDTKTIDRLVGRSFAVHTSTGRMVQCRWLDATIGLYEVTHSGGRKLRHPIRCSTERDRVRWTDFLKSTRDHAMSENDKLTGGVKERRHGQHDND